MRMCDLAAAPAAVAERPHPPPRRAGARWAGRAPAVADGSAGDARRAHRRRPERIERGRSDARRQRPPARHRPTRTSATSRPWPGSSRRCAPGCAPARRATAADESAAAARVRLPRRQRRGQGRHRRLRRRRGRRPVAAAGVFTRSRFAGPSVELSRRHLADGQAQAVVVVSKNANVATGPAGRADAEALVAAVAERLGCAPGDVARGLDGRDRAALPAGADPRRRGGDAGVARRHATPPPRRPAIMTTDTVAKVASAGVGAGPGAASSGSPRASG